MAVRQIPVAMQSEAMFLDGVLESVRRIGNACGLERKTFDHDLHS